jgi:hypothetical protein
MMDQLTKEEEDQLTIATAESYLQRYPLLTEPHVQLEEKKRYLDPRRIVQAALDHAPTTAGRVNIAKAIVNTDEDPLHKQFNARLEELARHIFYNLLKPHIFHNFVVDGSESTGWSYSNVREKHATIWV